MERVISQAQTYKAQLTIELTKGCSLKPANARASRVPQRPRKRFAPTNTSFEYFKLKNEDLLN
jgi:hypothetical protein